MKVKFYNKNGELSEYSFCCGYVQSEEKDNIRKELYKDSVYHFKVISRKDGLVERLVWNSFYSLTDARKAYKLYKI